MVRPSRTWLLALTASAACSAFRLPPEEDPDRSRHAYELVGEARLRDGGLVVPGAEVTVTGAREVAGSRTTDQSGRFWLQVSGLSGGSADRAGLGKGPAGMVILSARAGGLCAPETKVLVPAPGPIQLVMAPCP
jgi:hypothetical protein